ncbi:MAG TPA: anti-sigma factor [Solirubrobacteraceae bacterium]|nr:anti-sigma factor [Solirubrobacteraceae bacterium]
MIGCARHEEVASYVLGALPEEENERFEAHLETCDDCMREVAELQVAADALPLAAVQVAPPPELKDRLMTVVRSEAQLLQAAEAPAREAAPPREKRRRWWGLRPLPAIGLATAVLAVAVVAGVLVTSGDNDAHTVQAKVTLVAAPNARASLEVKGDQGTLNVSGFPPPGNNRVYQAWRMRGGKPVPAGLFRVGGDGKATLAIEEPLKTGDQVLVTIEPGGGSAQPTSNPIAAASLA